MSGVERRSLPEGREGKKITANNLIPSAFFNQTLNILIQFHTLHTKSDKNESSSDHAAENRFI